MCDYRNAARVAPALIAAALAACAPADRPRAAGAPANKADPPRPLTRLIYQDHDARALRWADVSVNGEGALTLAAAADVPGFPKLDVKKQKLVQMRESGGLVMVGVRDDEEGAFGSGWVLLHAGVGYTDHGDHGHWLYKTKPAVWDHRLDKKQGNPAHLYLYGEKFFLAHDKLNGYTRLDPGQYEKKAGAVKKGTPRFLVGGGNHITLAVVDDKVGYSCWIDGGGPNKGRVDVTPVTAKEKTEPAYTFRLPSGVIHGATACAGKVFFAPADGVCWVEADRAAKRNPGEVKVHHVSLGKDGDKPRRTGAFASHGDYVLCVAGKGPGSSLVLLDAKAREPKPIFVPLGVKKGSQAVTPAVAVTPEGKAYAFVFHDHAKDVEVEDALEVIDLDPDGDGRCTDAKVVKTLKVGRSAAEGHFGHHAVAFDADRRFAFFTNPGDGTISALSLKSLAVVATFKVGGKPTAIVARGGKETED